MFYFHPPGEMIQFDEHGLKPPTRASLLLQIKRAGTVMFNVDAFFSFSKGGDSRRPVFVRFCGV